MFMQFSLIDRILVSLDNATRTLFAPPHPQRSNPASHLPEDVLFPEERKLSAALMRVNHTGEVCAQALYYGQSIATRHSSTRETLLQAAEEETDHLAWCQDRLMQLNSHTSYLNPLWYISSFSLGLLFGAVSDQLSLGFVVETERQVEQHIDEHLQRLPIADKKSQVILEQMKKDEINHAAHASLAGATELPNVVKWIMKKTAKVMTKTAFYI